MKPYYQHAGITIYHGDCREVLPMLEEFDMCLTDPPYGISYAARQPHAVKFDRIVDDDKQFDPSHLMTVAEALVIWGGNNFASSLPVGGWICWDKRVNERLDVIFGSPFELAWCSKRNLYKMIRLQHGGARNADAKSGNTNDAPRFHPTQKPVRLMQRCISFFPMISSVIDPYSGSGSSLLAAKNLGLSAVGIEIEERYCELAAKRLSQEVLTFEETL